MKVTSVSPIQGEFVTVDGFDGDWPTTLMRYSAENWRYSIGESYEALYDCAEVEALYQTFNAAHPVLTSPCHSTGSAPPNPVPRTA